MNRLNFTLIAAIAAIVLSIAPYPARAELSADDVAFAALADGYINDQPEFSSVLATQIGDHRADHQLDQVDANARDAKRKLLRRYIDALAVIDWARLSRANQIDANILSNKLQSDLWSLDVLQDWAWDPMFYVNLSGNSIYGLLSRDYAPLEQRLMSAAARLREIPRFLQQARASIDASRVPRVHAETALQQNPGLLSIIDTMIVPQMNVLSVSQQLSLNEAIEVASVAVHEHQSWLEELLPNANGDFRIGADLYDQKLAFALNSPLSRRQITAMAEQEYANVRNEMYEVASQVYKRRHPYTAFPDSPDESFKQAIIRAGLEEAYALLPPVDGIVDVAKQQLQQAIDFVVEHDIVTMPEEPVEIIIMPEFQRGVSVAYLDPPGPLDRDQPAFYAVAPLPSDWADEQINSFLREYNLYSIQDLTIHEGVPGHYLQLALSNRYPSTLRAVLWSGTFVEGWGVYAEQMMIAEGYLDHDPLMKLINLKWYLRSITNAIIDSAIHVDGMSRDAAMHLMIEGGFQEEREAAGKWVRAQLTSGQLSTYFVGYQEHVALRRAVEAAWGDSFSLRRYHDQLLSYGSPPVRYVRALMLEEDIPNRNN